jgi:pimeloyl-ACP methyl ester carboxylesterase
MDGTPAVSESAGHDVAYLPQTVAKINGLEIVYDVFGPPDAPPMLLIAGLGAQLIWWDEAFCRQLAARGYRLIRFDNRDVGLSTKFDPAGVPDVLAMLGASTRGQRLAAPYTIRDMAADAAGLLDVLGIEAAHVFGVSMGGMIAQDMASHDPHRVRTLISYMSSSGGRDLPPPTADALSLLTLPAPADRASYLEQAWQWAAVLNGPAFPFDPDRVRTRAEQAFDRCHYPQGTARQLAGILASGSRRSALGAVQAPTLVIHGDADPLVPVEAGRDTAAAVPGAKLMIIEGLGHQMPPAVWPQLIEAVAGHAV